MLSYESVQIVSIQIAYLIIGIKPLSICGASMCLA